jgi:hypothetical protein
MGSTTGNVLGRVALVAATLGAGLVAGAGPAWAGPSVAKARCVIGHDLYQQPVATIVAYADGEGCPTPEHPEGKQVTLRVWRNDVEVASISGGIAPHYEYHCITTAPTRWRTNWDAEKIFNCG